MRKKLVAEFMLFVILCVTAGSKEQGLMAGITIDGRLALEALFSGLFCGASMNPARSLAPALVSMHFDFLWIYLTAPIVCAFVAVPLWKLSVDASHPQRLFNLFGDRL